MYIQLSTKMSAAWVHDYNVYAFHPSCYIWVWQQEWTGEYCAFIEMDQIINDTCIFSLSHSLSLLSCHVQREALFVKQTAIHGGHMCEAP